MSAAGALELELLGVPVRIEAPDDELAARLATCYARSRAPALGSGALSAGLERVPAGWRVSVDGRDERVEAGAVEAVRALNHELLQALMARAPEPTYVHAAVCEWRGRAIVLPGLSQAGKSTLALALVLQGARYLSDEILAYEPASGRALPFPRALKIRDECVEYFPELAGRFRGEGEGRFLPFEALRADVLAAPAPVGAVVVPKGSGDEPTRLAPISAGAALLHLAASSLNFGAHRTASIDRLAALLSGARTLELAWREPRGAVRALLEELAW